MKTETFKEWWVEVNRFVSNKIGVDADDMGDLIDVRELYENDVSPSDCADDLLKNWEAEGDIPADFL